MSNDPLIIEVADEIYRRLTRKKYDVLLAKHKIYSLDTLKDDPEYFKKTYHDHLLDTLRVSSGYRVIRALYEDGLISSGLAQKLQDAGYELGILETPVEAVMSPKEAGPVAKEIRHVRAPLGRAQTVEDNIRIVFITADPLDATRLRLTEEHREIQEQLRKSEHRDKISLYEAFAVRPQDFSQILLEHRPNIVHFSGHGTNIGEICIEDRHGKLSPVSPDVLATLFEQFRDTVACVLLNACFSRLQAEAINQKIKYVIGMNNSISDEAAIAFSIGFYQALGAGRRLEEAFELGKVQIGLHGSDEHNIPEILIGK